MAKFTLVGAMNLNGAGLSAIKYDAKTGDVVLFDDIAGNILLSEITLPRKPQCVVTMATIQGMADQYNGKGAILYDGGFIILKEDTAEYYSYSNLHSPQQTVVYSTDEEYDEDDE